MAQGQLLLERHTTQRPIRTHEGRAIAPASNLHWSSDGLEIPCWSAEVARLTFVIDTHDREVMAWVAATGGINGEMVRNLMLACVERSSPLSGRPTSCSGSPATDQPMPPTPRATSPSR